MDTMIIGIAGGTGSGKTTLTRRLQDAFGADVSVVYHDNYYKKHVGMTYEERAALNYDHPDAFDTGLMVDDLRKLAAGQAIRCTTTPSTTARRKRWRCAPPRWLSWRASSFSPIRPCGS